MHDSVLDALSDSFGDNAAFALTVPGHDRRVGIIVPRPARWREALGVAGGPSRPAG